MVHQQRLRARRASAWTESTRTLDDPAVVARRSSSGAPALPEHAPGEVQGRPPFGAPPIPPAQTHTAQIPGPPRRYLLQLICISV